MSGELDQIEDEGLKQALRRAVPRVAAPEALRQRVQAAFHAGGEAGPLPLRIEPKTDRRTVLAWLNRSRVLAMAAAVAGLFLGIGLYRATSEFENSSTIVSSEPVSPFGPSTPAYVANAVSEHRDLQESSRSPGSMLVPYDQLWKDWQKSAGSGKPNVDLGSLGWTLQGGRRYGPEVQSAVQFIYRKGSQPVSVFLIPDREGEAQHPSGSGIVRGHQVAARHMPGLTVCVVGGAPQTSPDLRELATIADHVAGR